MWSLNAQHEWNQEVQGLDMSVCKKGVVSTTPTVAKSLLN